MTVVRSIAAVTSGLIIAMLVSCATTPHAHMMSYADQLDRNAAAFASAGVTASPAGHSSGAREFADQAQDFRQTVERLAGDSDVVSAYERLWHSYQSLRYVVRQSDSQWQVAFKPVTQAFRAVQRGMLAYSDPSVQARAGYWFDPYYN